MTYAALRDAEQKPDFSKRTILDKLMKNLIRCEPMLKPGVTRKIEGLQTGGGELYLALDDYPGLKTASTASNEVISNPCDDVVCSLCKGIEVARPSAIPLPRSWVDVSMCFRQSKVSKSCDEY